MHRPERRDDQRCDWRLQLDPDRGPGPRHLSLLRQVTDNGSPVLSDDEEITVTVNEVNRRAGARRGRQPERERRQRAGFTATASDRGPARQHADLQPGQRHDRLRHRHRARSRGATINASTGAFSWTPTEAQGPGTYHFFVTVTDNGSPVLSDDEEITVTVNEVNRAPELGAIGNKSVNEGTPSSFTATATDADVPANALSFSLVNGTTGCGTVTSCTVPSGASINASTGAFSWTPSDNGTFRFKVRVTDNGTPVLSDDEEITVTVNDVAPTIGTATVAVDPISGVVTGNVSWTDPGADTETIRFDYYRNDLLVDYEQLSAQASERQSDRYRDSARARLLHVDDGGDRHR